ncbi:hypothetical protein ANN_11810 [Periplaneta americana]|uniref:DUF4817 domain-containing protein n=1 Tax=Periplaneta americana TaxID=6978 RepID=A0ABQ8T7I9_PERAM|nr:hypothetical protein ANN_11810 [Periplaneta americana]
MERSLTPVSEKVEVGADRKKEKCTAIIASHNVLVETRLISKSDVTLKIPTRNTILRWVASFRITGSTLKKKSPGRNSIALRLSEATVRSRALRLLSLGPFEGCCVGVRLCDMYSNQELAEIHFMYGKADDNAALARRLYQERYPQRQCPDRKTFVRLHYRLCEYGKFNSPSLGRGRPRSTTPEVQDEILEAVNMTPSISTRRVRLETLNSRRGQQGRGKTKAQSIRDETGSSRGGSGFTNLCLWFRSGCTRGGSDFTNDCKQVNERKFFKKFEPLNRDSLTYCDSDVRFELTTSVPQERKSRGALWNGARMRGERANAAREWREFARASSACLERPRNPSKWKTREFELSRLRRCGYKLRSRRNDSSFRVFSYSVSEKARASKPAGVRLECASASASASEGLSSSAVDRSWRDLSSSAVDRSWRDPSSSTVNCL